MTWSLGYLENERIERGNRMVETVSVGEALRTGSQLESEREMQS